MRRIHEPPSASAKHYAVAYAIHHTECDLRAALGAYGQVIESHPRAIEAGYARSQIRNIVNLVVPAAELVASQIALVLRHLQPTGDDSPPGSQ